MKCLLLPLFWTPASIPRTCTSWKSRRFALFTTPRYCGQGFKKLQFCCFNEQRSCSLLQMFGREYFYENASICLAGTEACIQPIFLIFGIASHPISSPSKGPKRNFRENCSKFFQTLLESETRKRGFFLFSWKMSYLIKHKIVRKCVGSCIAQR